MSQNPSPVEAEPMAEASVEMPKAVGEPLQASGAGRRLWLLATAALAAAAGAGLAWRRLQASEPTAAAPAEGFWDMRWPTPNGQTLSMQSFQGKPLLLNFWATWCPPCVEELPRINAFYRRNVGAGWQVLGLALDNLAPVQTFLQKTPVDFPVGLAGMAGAELARSLGNVAGALPFSVVISAKGEVLVRKMGPLSDRDLSAWIGLK